MKLDSMIDKKKVFLQQTREQLWLCHPSVFDIFMETEKNLISSSQKSHKDVEEHAAVETDLKKNG